MKQRKLQTRLSIYFSLIAIIPALIVMSMSIKFTMNSTEELVGVYTEKLIEQLSYNVNNFILAGRSAIGDLTSSTYIQQVAKKYDSLDANAQSVLRGKVQETVVPVIKGQDSISGVYICGNDYIYYRNVKTEDTFDIQSFKLSKAYERLINAETTEFIWFTMADGKIYMARKILNKGDSAIILAMNTTYLNELLDLSNVAGKMSLAILDENNKIIAGSIDVNKVQQMMQVMGEEAVNEIVRTSNIANNITSLIKCTNGWQVISIAPVKVLMSDFNKSCIYIVLILCICSIGAILLSNLMGRKLTHPLTIMAQYMKSVENGKFTFKEDAIKTIHSKDLEVNLLVNGLIHMLRAIRQMLEASQNVTQKVKENTKALKAQGEVTAVSAKSVSQTVTQVASGAKAQSEQTEQTAELMEALANHVSEVSTVVSNIQSVSQEIMAVSEKNKQSLKTLDEKALKNIEMSHKVGSSVKALSEETTNIYGILKMVTAINTQTEILSFNASIEAARAGSFGQGFAVIATEVRNLSLQTREAICAIQGLLAVIEEKSQSAFNELTEATMLFESQRPLVQEANKKFEGIVDQMEYINEEINHTNRLIQVIDEHKKSVLEKIVKINGIAQEFACVTEEVNEKTIMQAECATIINDLALQMSETVKELEKCY